MKKFITLSVLFFGIITFSQSKEQKIKDVITLSNGSKMASSGIQQFINFYKEKYKDLPDSFWSEFLREGDPNNITKLYVPIYDKFFTEAEIDQLIDFYKTPVGKKMVANMPAIMEGKTDVSKLFTEAEMNQLTVFYKTDAWKKMADNMPAIMQETKIFAEGLNKRINEKINNHYGYQSPPPPPSAPNK